MRYLSVLIILVLFSCGDEKIIQLPEIKNADITEVLDVSQLYFREPTDHLLMKINNTIGVNVTNVLKTSILIKLQINEAMHKNEMLKYLLVIYSINLVFGVYTS